MVIKLEDEYDFAEWLIAREECIMDLDDEELIATRKLNGVGKYNEGVIKGLKNQLELAKAFNNKTTLVLTKDIEDILTEREEYKARIKELEAKLEFKEWGDLDNTQFEEYMNQFISRQKVKDKIEELKDKIEKYKEYRVLQKETDVEYYENIGNEIARDILEELLEEK